MNKLKNDTRDCCLSNTREKKGRRGGGISSLVLTKTCKQFKSDKHSEEKYARRETCEI